MIERGHETSQPPPVKELRHDFGGLTGRGRYRSGNWGIAQQSGASGRALAGRSIQPRSYALDECATDMIEQIVVEFDYPRPFRG